ncbi:hypothetical protein M0R45_035017 [Rubus argutus]|uniref:Uncharacterized protein n=1 Tax=Rubus argutus TaxID=59490 RepID=A0AAW1VRV3_RUBAR
MKILDLGGGACTANAPILTISDGHQIFRASTTTTPESFFKTKPKSDSDRKWPEISPKANPSPPRVCRRISAVRQRMGAGLVALKPWGPGLQNPVRQRDSLKSKLESTTGERDKLKARVSELERKEASRCPALEDEVAGLKAKVAELPEVVAREKRIAAEEALEHFRSSSEVAVLKEAEYDRGFEAGYNQHFHTLIEKGWINVDQYYADMEREARERQEKSAGPKVPPSGEPCSKPPGGEVELIHVEDETEDPEGCDPGEGQEVFGTPEKPAAQGDAEGGDAGREGLKPNGDPITPGVTPSTGGVQSGRGNARVAVYKNISCLWRICPRSGSEQKWLARWVGSLR